MKTTDFAEYLTSYFSVWLPGQRILSSNTILSYRDTFRLLLTYCKTVKGINLEKLTVKMLTESLVSEFLQWLEDERGCSITTRNQQKGHPETDIQPFYGLSFWKELREFAGIQAIAPASQAANSVQTHGSQPSASITFVNEPVSLCKVIESVKLLLALLSGP